MQFAHTTIRPHYISSTFQIHPCGWANCNSPLHVCYLNVGKYTYKSCKYTKRRHGHGMREFACVVGAKSASWRSGVCDAIRPHRKFTHIVFRTYYEFAHVANSPMFSITFNGRANCPQWMGELQFAHVAIHPYCKFIPYCKIHPRCKIRPHFKFTHMEGRITIRPYTCIFWMLANIM